MRLDDDTNLPVESRQHFCMLKLTVHLTGKFLHPVTYAQNTCSKRCCREKSEIEVKNKQLQ